MREGSARIEMCEGQPPALALLAPLEFLMGEYLAVVVREHRLPPGVHEVEATAQLFGLGELARWRDHLV